MEEKDFKTYKIKQKFFNEKYKNRGKVLFEQPIRSKEDILRGIKRKGKTYIKPKEENV